MKKVQIYEKALKVLFAVHIAAGVDVDQCANAGYDQGHRHAERVNQQSRRRVKAADSDPVPQMNGCGPVMLIQAPTGQRKVPD